MVKYGYLEDVFECSLQLRNLQTLELREMAYEHDQLHQILLQCEDRRTWLQALRSLEVSLESNCAVPFLSDADFAALLQIPNLEKLSIFPTDIDRLTQLRKKFFQESLASFRR